MQNSFSSVVDCFTNRRYPSTTQLQKHFDYSPDIICSIDLDGNFIDVSGAALQVLGYTPAELIGKPFMDLVFVQDRLKTEGAIQRVMHGARLTNFENRYRHKDGHLVPLLWSAQWDAREKVMFGTARDATEKKSQDALQRRYEQESKQQNRELSEMLERITDGFFALDNEWRFTYGNPQIEQMLNIKVADYLSRSYWECFPEMIGSEYEHQYRKAMKEKVPVHFESYFPVFDRWFSVDAYPSRTGLSVFFRDVSAGRQSREEMKRLSLIAREMVNPVWLMDRNFRILWVNEAFPKVFGYTKEEALGRFPGELFTGPETDPVVVARMLKALNEGNQFQCEIVNYTKQKEKLIVQINCHPVFDEAGNIIQFFTLQINLTEQKRVEKELRKLSLVARETECAVVIIDPDRKTTWVNAGFTRMTGYSYEEVIGKKPADLLEGPGTDPKLRQYIIEQYRKEKPFQFEALNYKKSGEPFWSEVHVQPLFDNEGKLEQFFSIRRDITQHKKIEEELRRSNERFRLAAKSDAIYDWDLCSNNLQFGDGLYSAFGYKAEEMDLAAWSRALHPEDRESTEASLFETLGDGISASWEMEYRMVKKNGSYAFVLERGNIIRDDSGEAVRMVGVLIDVTERRHAEWERKEFERRMNAAAIAAQEKERAGVGLELHDNVNQVLTTVKLYTELVRDGVGDKEEILNKSIKLLQDSIDEIRSLSKRLSAPTLGDIKLKESVKELLDAIIVTGKVSILLDASEIDGLEVSKEVHLAVYRMLQEHLTNILKHAMAENVKVSFQLRNRMLFLQVVDDGKGFEPKQKREGIGISNMKTRAENLNGIFTLTSNPGKGCTMMVRLPL